jgi:two-component system, OmpR family, sensor kinase
VAIAVLTVPRLGRHRYGSMRVRIVLWHVLLLAVVLASAIVTMRVVLLVRMDERIDREFQQETAELRSLAGSTDLVTGRPFSQDAERLLSEFMDRNVPVRNEVFLTYVDGTPHRQRPDELHAQFDSDAAFTARLAEIEDVERGEVEDPQVGTIAFQAVPLRVDGQTRGVFVSAWLRDLEADEIDEVVLAAGVLGALALVVASAIVWSVTGRVLRPARAVASTARSITETGLGRRIDVQGNDEIAEIAETFNGMLDRLEVAFAAQRNFVNDASHELRTPITIIRGNLELLDIGDTEDRRVAIEVIADELDRMHRMVEDLLLLAKAQRPDFLRYDRVELHELTSEVFHKATALAPRRWVLGNVADGELVGDRQRLTQALVQLAQNAVQHTQEGDRIALGSDLRDGEAHLWVADSGPGVDPDVAHRIFERFARADAPGHHEGAGLGLAIVRAISEAHGGRVQVSESADTGATFTLTVPAEIPTTHRTVEASR